MSIPDLSDLDCQVCFNRFTPNLDQRKPRLLDCGHTFCSECLEILIVSGSVRCPNDRQDTRIDPEKGILTLKPNYILIRLMADQPTSTTKCSASEECKADATLWCSKCDVELCASCNEMTHQKSKYAMFRNHPICKLNEKPVSIECEEHGEPRKIFCLDDQKVICTLCTMFGSHNGHSVEMLKKAAKDRRKVHSDNIGELQDILTTLQEKTDSFSQLLSEGDTEQQMDELNSRIAKRLSELKSELGKRIDQQHQREKEALLKDLEKEFGDIRKKALSNMEEKLQDKKEHSQKKLVSTAESKKKIRKHYNQLLEVSSEIDKCVQDASHFIGQDDFAIMSASGMVVKLENANTAATTEIEKAPTAESFSSSSNWVTDVNAFGIEKFNVNEPEAKTERRKFMLGTPESVQVSGFKLRTDCNSIYDKVGILNSRHLFQARDRTDLYLWYHDELGRWRVSPNRSVGATACWVYSVAENMDHPIQLGTNSTWEESDDKHEWHKCEVCVKAAPPNS